MEHNFDQHIADGDDLNAYDYGSIMHYPRTRSAATAARRSRRSTRTPGSASAPASPPATSRRGELGLLPAGTIEEMSEGSDERPDWQEDP